jgi:hypothetical protein
MIYHKNYMMDYLYELILEMCIEVATLAILYDLTRD